MKPLSNHRLTKFVAAAALAGISFASAYAAPNYVTPVNSPIDTTSLVSVSAPLNNFNGYLSAIQAKLDLNAVTGDTVRTPNLGGGVAVKDADFVAAVAAAVAADTAHAAEIVSAGVQFKPGKAKDILKAVATGSPSVAPAAVAAAALVYSDKAADIATGAILGLIASSPSGANNGQMDDAASAIVNSSTRALIEKVAKAAVSATKGSLPVTTGPTSQQAVRAKEVAGKLLDAFLTDAASSNGELYLDDIGRGAVAGISGFPVGNVSASDIATEMLGKFASHGALNTEYNVTALAMGILNSSIINGLDGNGFVAVQAAIDAATTFDTGVDAGAKVQKYLREQALLGRTDSQLITDYQSKLTTADYDHIYAFITGASQFKIALAPSFVTASFTDTDKPAGAAFTNAMKQDIVRGATTANFGNVSQVVTNAITATGGLAPNLAVAAAIPAATDLESGLAVTAAIKNGSGTPLSTSDAQGVLSAAITAAVTAGYQRALPDIALAAAKARKDIDNELVTTAVTGVPNGWEEAVAAHIIANNPNDAVPSSLNNNKQAAINAATGKLGADVSSVTLAVELAIRAKASAKTVFDDAIASLNGATVAINTTVSGAAKPRAVIFGASAGAGNADQVVPLLAAAMRLKSGGDTDADLLNYAISLNKKSEALIRAGFETAQDVIANPDNLFDAVDHKILTNPEAYLEITQAAVAARPEYAHYAARAAAFRTPDKVQNIATSAIQFANMRTNGADDPAAVAAISAATVLGLKDSQSTKQTALMTAAITGLVKGCLLFTNNYGPSGKDDTNGLQGNTATFPEATGTGATVANVTLKRSKGTAAVLTGAIAQLQAEGATTLNALSTVAITAAGKAMKNHALAFAQAAGAAAQAVAAAGSATFTDFAGIAAALVAAGITDTGFANAAQVGAAQYTANIYGAGAAGIRNYAHHSGLNAPVTSLFNF